MDKGQIKPAILLQNPKQKQKNILFQQNQRTNRDQRPILNLVEMRT